IDMDVLRRIRRIAGAAALDGIAGRGQQDNDGCEDAAEDRAVVGAPRGMAAAGDLVPGFRGPHLSAEHRSLRTTDSALRVLRIVRGRCAQRPAGGRDPLRTRPPSLLTISSI